MLYSKDEKKYTEMCKIFDEEFYSDNRDDAKLFKYMYLVYYMLACKKDFFKRFEDYDGYAYYAAVTIYRRYLKKLSKGEHIKSLLNYAKHSDEHLKVSYQNEEFNQIIKPSNKVDTTILESDMKASVQADYSYEMQEDIELALQDIINIVDKVIDEYNDKLDFTTKHNLHISVVLSLLDSITLPNNVKIELKKKKHKIDAEDIILKTLNDSREKSCIVFNLSDNYKGIVQILVNKVRQNLSAVLNETRQDYMLPDDVLDDILMSAYAETSIDIEEEDFTGSN